ncbi:MAG: hypothetical protein PUD40_08105, partial [Bacteroidales bacterium]|nr:hypothetical protein [Bacteroidales bacterium]
MNTFPAPQPSSLRVVHSRLVAALRAFTILLLLLAGGMTAAGQTYQSEPDVLTACRGYYELGGASVSTAELNTSKLTAWPNSGSGHC